MSTWLYLILLTSVTLLLTTSCQSTGMWDKPGISGKCMHVKMPSGDTQVVCY